MTDSGIPGQGLIVQVPDVDRLDGANSPDTGTSVCFSRVELDRQVFDPRSQGLFGKERIQPINDEGIGTEVRVEGRHVRFITRFEIGIDICATKRVDRLFRIAHSSELVR